MNCSWLRSIPCADLVVQCTGTVPECHGQGRGKRSELQFIIDGEWGSGGVGEWGSGGENNRIH